MSRPKRIETPEHMWELFQAYCEELKNNPRIKVEYVGKDGERVETPLQRPLTIEGFKNYCYQNIGEIQAYWINRDGAYSDYSPIIACIKDVIRQDQIEGGMVGQFNHTLTARLNGLVEKTENKNDNHEVIDVTFNLGK